jgi:hypothetical protein
MNIAPSNYRVRNSTTFEAALGSQKLAHASINLRRFFSASYDGELVQPYRR